MGRNGVLATRATLAEGGSRAWFFAACGVIAAMIPMAWMWGFTVDDALISIRYARHIERGFGYRFNVGGAVTDGVTPLPWPFVLAPLARGSAIDVLHRAKAIGAVAWVFGAGRLGHAIGRVEGGGIGAVAALVALLFCVPLAAHSVSGMETGLAIAMATMAALNHSRPWISAIFAAAATSLRPELLPWALVLTVGFSASGGRRSSPQWIGRMLLVATPFAACSLVRLVAFGRLAPLSMAAKPSDLSHGATYLAAAFLAAGVPLLVMTPNAFRASAEARAMVLAALVHFAVVVVVGGDWMPFARLITPVLPSLLYASVLLSAHAGSRGTLARAVVAIGFEIYVFIVASPSGRHVMQDWERLIADASQWFDEGASVAAVDVGWVSAATEARIIDLAGLTDPEIAFLGGGHTSKRIDAALLLGKRPEYLVFFADRAGPNPSLDEWQEAVGPRVVEMRLARSDVIASHFSPVAFLQMGERGAGYFVLKLKPPNPRQPMSPLPSF